MEHSISESTEINTSEQELFDFINTPSECVEASPSQTFSDIQKKDDGSHEFDYEYSMAGVSLTGHCTSKEFDPDAHVLVYDYTGGIDAEMRLDVKQNDEGGTVLKCQTTYEVPDSVFGSVVKPVIEKYNSREMRKFVGGVKEIVEEKPEP